MRREWSAEELIACWTLVEDDWRLLGNKTGTTRLGFSVLLKYFDLEARFPRHAGDVPRAAIDYVAQQVKVPPERFADYDWSGRAIKYHRAQIRKALGFREATVGDEDKLAAWLAEEVCPVELSDERLREALVARCRVERIEPPAPSRLERVLGTARAASDQRFTADITARLSAKAVAGLEALVAETEVEPDGQSGLLAELKADPGKRNIETLVVETEKLARVRAIGLPPSCSPSPPISWSTPGGPGRHGCTPPNCVAGTGTPHAAGLAVLGTPDRDHRRPGRPAHQPGPQGRRHRRAQGRGRDARRPPPGAGQAGPPLRPGRGRPRPS